MTEGFRKEWEEERKEEDTLWERKGGSGKDEENI